MSGTVTLSHALEISLPLSNIPILINISLSPSLLMRLSKFPVTFRNTVLRHVSLVRIIPHCFRSKRMTSFDGMFWQVSTDGWYKGVNRYTAVSQVFFKEVERQPTG